MVITFCNGKGGAGKTTLSILLGCALADAGRRVAFIDRDPQKTATRWIRETNPAIAIANPDENYDAIIVDTPPQLDSPLLRESLLQADKVMLVSSPSPADLWTSQATAGLVRMHHGKGKAALLFNQVQRHTVLARDLNPMAASIGLPALRNSVARRQCYQHALLLGWKALDGPAREEILQVALEIITY
jgi:chromosome partitioning protein